MIGFAARLRERWRGSSTLRGTIYMLVSTFCSTAMHGVVRYLSADLPTFELVFFRNLFGFACLLPWLITSGFAGFRSARLSFHIFRALLGIAGLSTWFYGLALVPLAEATALNFLGAIFTCLGAALFLGERMHGRRWLAVLIGFAGTLVMLRPGAEAVSFGAIVVIFSAVLWSGSLIMLKHLSATDSSVTIVGTLYFFLVVFSLGPALLVWRTPTPSELAWLVIMGGIGAVSHLTLARAFQAADTGQLMPLDFTRLIWASLIGWLVLAESPDLWTWLGGILIFAGSMLTTARGSAKTT